MARLPKNQLEVTLLQLRGKVHLVEVVAQAVVVVVVQGAAADQVG